MKIKKKIILSFIIFFYNFFIIFYIYPNNFLLFDYQVEKKNYNLRLISKSRVDPHVLILKNLFYYENKLTGKIIGCGELKKLNFSDDKKYFYGNLDYYIGISGKEDKTKDFSYNWLNNKKECPNYFILNLETSEYLKYSDKKEFEKELANRKLKNKFYEFIKFMKKNAKKVSIDDNLTGLIEDWKVKTLRKERD